MKDQEYMRRCLELAAKGSGAVAPNPMVGSVIVHSDRIIGEGYHQKYGGPHAEVNAINSVSEEDRHLLPDSTLYVNLEPCSHFGKTPPCADLVVATKLARIVVANDDPNPLVSGRGFAKLRAAGIAVTMHVLQEEADFLNRRFFTSQKKHRPYVILKWAQSADGFMAPADGMQMWLTGKESQVLVHEWRSQEQAILIGTRTVEIDDPELTVRHVPGENPVRVVIDRDLSLPADKKVFMPGARTIVFSEAESARAGHVERVRIDFQKNVPEQILSSLLERGIHSVIVEGGPFTLEKFIAAGLWDEARIFTSRHVLGEGKKSPAISGTVLRTENGGSDSLEILMAV